MELKVQIQIIKYQDMQFFTGKTKYSEISKNNL